MTAAKEKNNGRQIVQTRLPPIDQSCRVGRIRWHTNPHRRLQASELHVQRPSLRWYVSFSWGCPQSPNGRFSDVSSTHWPRDICSLWNLSEIMWPPDFRILRCFLPVRRKCCATISWSVGPPSSEEAGGRPTLSWLSVFSASWLVIAVVVSIITVISIVSVASAVGVAVGIGLI